MSEVQHGDTWETRDGRAVVVASNRWPPPAPGSHESDLGLDAGIVAALEGVRWSPITNAYCGGRGEYWLAMDWSRANRGTA